MRRPSTVRRSRPRALLATALLAATLGLAGCSGSASEDSSKAASGHGGGDSAYDSSDSSGPRVADGGAAEGADRKQPGGGNAAARKPPKLAPSQVIRTATLTVQVKDVPGALDRARTTVESAGGYIGDETTDRDADGHERSRIVLRIPQEEYETVLDDLAGTGRLIERKVSAKDVTEQVVDVESRIRSQEASVARVRKLMDRATQLSDVVTLEGELGSRQAELEALKAQQQSLKERVGMSTVTLVLSETDVKPESGDEETGFLDALAGGWKAFLTAVRWIALALGAVLPFAVALALLVLLRRVVRSRLPRQAASTSGGVRGVTPPQPVTVPAPSPAPEGSAGHEESRKED
ncbi:DUF4349 domain-containing protein [Streptomyces sp. NPDC004647]|uniref:DUF4349 domain-containing protein n=1 Tax=Streptomyces sp. NPDC004647 TaxID=3154671 RepID=UPI0033A1E626